MTWVEILLLTFPEPEPPAGRQDDFRLLEEKLRDARQCIILLGPRGAGKSTLLNSFFSPEYRLRATRENRQLFTAPARYPAHMTYNEVYAFFSDMIVQACLWALPACGEAETQAAQQSELLSRSYMSTGAAKMQSLVGLLHRQGWAVSLVLDNFELFTSSREVKREHHGVMNELVDQKGLRLVAVGNGRVIAAGWSGKVKTFSTMVGLCLMMAFPLTWLDWAVTAVITVTTLYSGVEYFVKNWDVIRP